MRFCGESGLRLVVLIERALPRELGGSVRIHYERAGVICEIDAALKAA